MRHLFAIILFHCDVADPRSLYNAHWSAMSEDYAYHQPALNEMQLHNCLVRDLDTLLGTMYSRSIFEWIPNLKEYLLDDNTLSNISTNHLLELQQSSLMSDIQQQLDRLPLLHQKVRNGELTFTW